MTSVVVVCAVGAFCVVVAVGGVVVAVASCCCRAWPAHLFDVNSVPPNDNAGVDCLANVRVVLLVKLPVISVVGVDVVMV